MVAEYLAASCRTCSLSVFLPEAGLDEAKALTHEDILALLKLTVPSAITTALRAGLAELASAESAHILG